MNVWSFKIHVKCFFLTTNSLGLKKKKKKTPKAEKRLMSANEKTFLNSKYKEKEHYNHQHVPVQHLNISCCNMSCGQGRRRGCIDSSPSTVTQVSNLVHIKSPNSGLISLLYSKHFNLLGKFLNSTFTLNDLNRLN